MLSVTTLPGFPLVGPGDALAPLICAVLSRAAIEIRAGDILVVASKIVSLSENRQVRLDEVQVSREAARLAAKTDKDPQQVADRIAPYVERGFSHPVFHSPTHDQAAFLKSFSERIFPVLRRRFS